MNQHVVMENLYFERDNHIIFSNLNLKIARNKVTAIMGPSGSGKTTLLKLIGAQLYPKRGKILFNGKNIHHLSRKELNNARCQMGLLFQEAALFTHLNVFENVAFPLRENSELLDFMIRDLVLMHLETVGLRGTALLKPSQLSSGMARRVALARTIALDPSLIMYDEPFTGQDPITMAVLMRLIQHLNRVLGLTTVIVSHDVQETLSIADYVYIIFDGKVVGEGRPQKILASENLAVQQFTHGLADGIIPFHYPAEDYRKDLGLADA